MAIEIPLFKPGFAEAANDLSAKQYFAAKIVAPISGLFAADLQTTAGAPILGIIQNKPVQFEAVELETSGISKAVAGAAFAVGDLLMVTAAGKLVTCTAGNDAVAQALEAATADLDLVTVKLGSYGKR